MSNFEGNQESEENPVFRDRGWMKDQKKWLGFDEVWQFHKIARFLFPQD